MTSDLRKLENFNEKSNNILEHRKKPPLKHFLEKHFFGLFYLSANPR